MARRKRKPVPDRGVPDRLLPYSSLWEDSPKAWVKARYDWFSEQPAIEVRPGQYIHSIPVLDWLHETRYYQRGPGKNKSAPRWVPSMRSDGTIQALYT